MNDPSNSQDALAAGAPKHGQGLRVLVETRRRELQEARARADAGPRAALDAALSALQGLLTGDLDQIPAAIAHELAEWIETSKYLGAKEVRGMIAHDRAAAFKKAEKEAQLKAGEARAAAGFAAGFAAGLAEGAAGDSTESK